MRLEPLTTVRSFDISFLFFFFIILIISIIIVIIVLQLESDDAMYDWTE